MKPNYLTLRFRRAVFLALISITPVTFHGGIASGTAHGATASGPSPKTRIAMRTLATCESLFSPLPTSRYAIVKPKTQNDLVLRKWANLLPFGAPSEPMAIIEAIAKHQSTIGSTIDSTTDATSPHYVAALTEILKEKWLAGADLESTRRYFELVYDWPEFAKLDPDDEFDGETEMHVRYAWFDESDLANPPIVIGAPDAPVRLEKTVRGISSNVQVLTVRSRRYFFRADGSGVGGGAARKTLATSLMNDRLSLRIVPPSWRAIVNGERGVLAASAAGKTRTFVPRVLETHVVKDNLADVIAFEFLVGNLDLHKGNFAYRGYGFSQSFLIEVFDHDHAFTIGGMFFKRPKWLGTSSLPDRYTENFITHLQSWTPDSIRSEFSTLLTPLEIEGVIFRRSIILKDFELRRGPLVVPSSSSKAS